MLKRCRVSSVSGSSDASTGCMAAQDVPQPSCSAMSQGPCRCQYILTQLGAHVLKGPLALQHGLPAVACIGR